MLPILIKLGPIPIRTFGLLAALAFLLGLWVALREARRLRIDPEKLQDVAIWCFIGIIGGGRLAYVLVSREQFIERPLSVFYIWEGGLVLYGGLLSCMFLGMWRVKRNRLPFWKVSDLFFMTGVLGLSLARIGCLCAGDDWGRVAPGITVNFPAGRYGVGTSYSWQPMDPERAKDPERPDSSIWDLTSRPSSLYEHQGEPITIQREGPGPEIGYRGFCREPCSMVIRIVEGTERPDFQYSTDGGAAFSENHPIPEDAGEFVVPGTVLAWAIRFPQNPDSLLDSAFVGEWLHPTQIYLSMNLFFIFLVLFIRHRAGVRFDGELLSIGMGIYSINRFIIEIFRGDLLRGAHGALSTSQWVSIPVLVGSVWLYLYLRRRARKRGAPQSGQV